MANNIFKLSGILKVAVLSADPSGGAPGSIYYNSTTGKFRMYDASGWNDSAIGNISLTGQPLSTSNVIVGDGSNLSAPVDTSAVGDALVTAAAGIVIKSNAITNGKIAAQAVTGAKIADNSVDTNHIVDSAIDFTKLADNAVTNTKIASNAVDMTKIADGAVTTTKIADDSVITSKIQDDAVTTIKIQDSSVTSDKIANGAVINSKLVGSANTIKGALGDAAVVDLTQTQATTLINPFQGDAGSGGLKGSVPAPATGDAAAGKFLSANGSWAVPTGAGDVTGPGSSTNNQIATFNGTTGKIIQASGVTANGAGALTASSVTASGLSANKAVVTSTGGLLAASATTDTEIGYVSGVTSAIQTQIDSKLSTATAASTYVPLTQKGSNNGVATLDAGGKIPASQLPNTVMEYQGAWNASTNSPTLADGTGNIGDIYRVSVAGSQNLGSGTIGFFVGDLVMYNGTIWERSPAADGVISVNGQQGAVTLTTDNINEGTTNKYYTDTRAKTASVVNSLAGSQTDQAPSVASVNTALAAKLSSVSQDTNPTLGGDLDLNDKAVKGILKHSNANAAQFFEEEYIHNQTLPASSSGATLAALQFAHATYMAMEFTYTVKEATTNAVRVGTLRITTNGTDIGLSDNMAESADIGVSWNASISGANLTVQYTTSANDKVVKGVVRRFLA